MAEIITTRCPLSGEEVQLYANDNGVSTNCGHCRVAKFKFDSGAFEVAKRNGFPLNGEVPFCKLRLPDGDVSVGQKLKKVFNNGEYADIRCRLTHFKRV